MVGNKKIPGFDATGMNIFGKVEFTEDELGSITHYEIPSGANGYIPYCPDR